VINKLKRSITFGKLIFIEKIADLYIQFTIDKFLFS